jgi:hypothetical protein
VTAVAALPTVTTAVAQAGPAEEEVVVPGTVQLEYDTSIFARTSGYMKLVFCGHRCTGEDWRSPRRNRRA